MLFLTADSGILGPIATVFGYLMNAIYIGLDKIGIGNIGIAIIIFTLITRLILFPFTVKQQKSSKIMAIIQPEIKAIQAKYEGKTDQQSMLMQQKEMKEVYERYGTSMTGSCVQLLIQMPILFALYRVIMNVPAYVSAIKIRFLNIIDAMLGSNDLNAVIKILTDFFNEKGNAIKGITLNQIHNFGTDGAYTLEEQKNFIIDFLYKLNPEQFKELATKFSSSAQTVINSEYAVIEDANTFLGMNLTTAPSAYGFRFTPYILVPIVAGLSQYLSVWIMQNQSQSKVKTDENDTMAQTMNSMNVMFPVMSAVICWGLATGIGVYWISTAVFMVLSQLIINSQLNKIDVDEMIKKNVEKANAKRKKKGLPPISEAKATTNIKKMEENIEKQNKEREELVKKQEQKTLDSEKYYFGDEADKDSLFAKANMVQKYNEKNNK